MADAWVHSNIQFGTDKRWARAAIALINGGSIRAPIARGGFLSPFHIYYLLCNFHHWPRVELSFVYLSIGSITNAALLTTMPFGSTIVAINVTGKTLMSAFENSVSTYNGSSNGRFLQMSGKATSRDLQSQRDELLLLYGTV